MNSSMRIITTIAIKVLPLIGSRLSSQLIAPTAWRILALDRPLRQRAADKPGTSYISFA